MDIKQFNKKWKQKFRPDLEFPIHIKRKIFNIYKDKVFEDLDKVVYELIFQELSKESNYFKNMITIDEINKGFKESDKQWFLPISKNWAYASRLNDIATIANIQ